MASSQDVLVAGESARPTLTSKDRCHDADDPDGVLVVVEPTTTRASAYGLCEGITVADVHDGYPPTDAVVICAYERTLDRTLDDWRACDDLATRLRDTDADLHYYPESKLELYTAGNYTESPDGTVCEHCQTGLDSTSDWVRHVVTECPSI